MSDEETRSQYAMLTKKQRQFLQNGGQGYDRKDAYEYREGIKKRVRHTILDFSLLLEHWDESEREEVFHEARDAHGGEFDEGLADMIALVYLEKFLHGRFKNLLLRSVNKGERQLAGDAELFVVQVDFEVNPIRNINLGDAINKFRKRGIRKMTDAERYALLHLLRNEWDLTWGDFSEMKEKLDERLGKKFAQERDEARAEWAENRREKQRRVNERRRERAEDVEE